MDKFIWQTGVFSSLFLTTVSAFTHQIFGILLGMFLLMFLYGGHIIEDLREIKRKKVRQKIKWISMKKY